MIKNIMLAAAILFPSGVHGTNLKEEPYLFKANDGTEVESIKGTFSVPENRENPNSRDITVSYVRFPSTSENPGAPIVYLAGGPGAPGVGTARRHRFPLFMAMREFGDVIALDQRGVGWSNHIPKCATDREVPLDTVFEYSSMVAELREAAQECQAFWENEGVDLSGYNTVESAKDINALREALGAEKISLWGISYGSHLALATIKEMEDRIDRIVLAGFEGLDETVKLPARTDAYLSRLQAALNEDPEAAKAFPDIIGMMHHVLAQLEKKPIDASFKDRSGIEIKMKFGKMEMQLVTSFMSADPRTSVRIPAMYAMAAQGDVSRIAPIVYRFLKKDPVSLRGMPDAMDIMSGISEERLALVQEQAKTAVLGDILNFPMPHLRGTLGLKDLGEEFRAPVETDIPSLVLSGTLDGRTYPESAKEGLTGFSNATHVIVKNGGHNVFMQHPSVSELILRFMRGEKVETQLTLPTPKFVYQKPE